MMKIFSNALCFMLVAAFYACSCQHKSSCITVAVDTIQVDTAKADHLFYRDVFNIRPHHILIKYNQPVNGYEVTVLCFPLDAYDRDRTNEIIGRAILHFESEHNKFNVYNDYYSDSTLYYLNEQKFENGQVLHLNYYPKKKDEYLSHNSPFFFSDVDFDGVEELIINNWRNGIRSNAYQIYKIGEGYETLEPLTYPPYNKMTNHSTEFDSINHTISGYWKDGAFETYKIQEGKSILLDRL